MIFSLTFASDFTSC